MNTKRRLPHPHPHPPWSDLPQELLSTIVELLHSNPLDILTFRSVCKSWCSSSSSLSLSSSLSPLFPLTPPPLPYTLLHRYSFLNSQPSVLSLTVIYSLRSPLQRVDVDVDVNGDVDGLSSWVVFLDQWTPGKVSLRKPFSRTPYSLPLSFPRSFDMLSLHATELGRFYNLSTLRDLNGKVGKPYVWCGLVLKVVVLFENDGDGGYVGVVALSDEGKLGLLRFSPGFNDDKQWEVVHDGKGFRFDDIVVYKGRVLGIDRRGRVYEVKVGVGGSVVLVSVGVCPIVGGGGRRKRLVESLGRLYLVVRCNVRGENEAIFKVYELNEGTKRWVEVHTLGDRTFFLGPEFSISVSAEELHGSHGKNCILFNKSFRSYDGCESYDDDTALYRKLKKHDLQIGVWRLEDAAHLGVIGSYPGYSEVFWPPPTWIWPNYLSERVGTLFTVLDRLQKKIPDYEELKVKFVELSVPQQRDALALMKLGQQLKYARDEAIEINKLLKLVETVAVSMQEHCESVIPHNQVGTSTVGTEERHASFDPFQILRNANKEGNGPFQILRNANKEGDGKFDLHSMEMTLNTFILRLEEDTSEAEDALNSPKMAIIHSLVHGNVE